MQRLVNKVSTDIRGLFHEQFKDLYFVLLSVRSVAF